MHWVSDIHSGRLVVRWNPWLPPWRRRRSKIKDLKCIASRSRWQASTAIALIDDRLSDLDKLTLCIKRAIHHRAIFFESREKTTLVNLRRSNKASSSFHLTEWSCRLLETVRNLVLCSLFQPIGFLDDFGKNGSMKPRALHAYCQFRRVQWRLDNSFWRESTPNPYVLAVAVFMVTMGSTWPS